MEPQENIHKRLCRAKHYPNRPVNKYRYTKEVYADFFCDKLCSENENLAGLTYTQVLKVLPDPISLVKQVQEKHDDLKLEYEKLVNIWKKAHPDEAEYYKKHLEADRQYYQVRSKPDYKKKSESKHTNISRKEMAKKLTNVRATINKAKIPDDIKNELLSSLQ